MGCTPGRRGAHPGGPVHTVDEPVRWGCHPRGSGSRPAQRGDCADGGPLLLTARWRAVTRA